MNGKPIQNIYSKSLVIGHSPSFLPQNPFVSPSHFVMEINRRDQRKRKRIDRLSQLPDSILRHILSFLPTKTSVATSTLAERWRFVWAYVPNLYFNSGENEDDIDRVLLVHKLPILKSFIIDFQEYEGYDEFEVETWIIAAIDRNVQYLHLSVVYNNPLPRRLFTCETLVDLRLCECGKIPTLYGMFLPRLKNLWLRYVKFEDDKSLPCLLSASPVLECFRFRSNDEISLNTCYVSSTTVRWLSLEVLVGSLGPTKQGNRLEINTPALEYISVLDDLSGPIEFGDLSGLIAADICHRPDYKEEEDEILCCVSLLKFVDSLSNVKCLKLDLSSYTKIVDSLFSAWTPSFNNLTKLELTADSCVLSKFLENANNLEILEFREFTEEEEEEGLHQLQGEGEGEGEEEEGLHQLQGEEGGEGEGEEEEGLHQLQGEGEGEEEEGLEPQHQLQELTKGWIEPQQVPKCLLSSLRTIRTVNTLGTDDGLEIIRYILRNAKVLKMMDITYPPCIDSEKKNDLLQKISLYERGSTACELAFTEASSEDYECVWKGISHSVLKF